MRLAVLWLLFVPQANSQAKDLDVLSAIPSVEWTRSLPGKRAGGQFHTERSTPVVHGELVYVGASGSHALHAFDLDNGNNVQDYPAEAAVYSQPVFTGGALFFSDSAGYTYRYEIGAKTPTWSHFSGVPIGSNPTLAGKAVLVATVDDLVFSLDTETGKPNWRYQHPPDATRKSELTLFGAPSPVVRDTQALFGFSDGALAGFDLETGELAWSRQVGEGRYPDLIATPALQGDDIYLGAFSKPFIALDAAGMTARWSIPYGTAAKAAIHNDRLYLGGSDGKLRAIDRITGEQAWVWDSKTAGALTEPQVAAAGIIVTSSDGGVYIVSTATGKLAWEYEPGHNLEGVSAGAALAGKRVIVVTNGGKLISFRQISVDGPPSDWQDWNLD